jgi:hypothetical protein
MQGASLGPAWSGWCGTLPATAGAPAALSMFHWCLQFHLRLVRGAASLHFTFGMLLQRLWCILRLARANPSVVLAPCCVPGASSSSVPFPVVPQPRLGEAFLCDPLADFLNLIPGGVQSWEPWDGLGTHGRTIPLGGSRRLPSLVPKYNQWLLSYVSCHVENTNNNHINIVRMKCAS